MNKNTSIYRWAAIGLAGVILLTCCSFIIYNSQKNIAKQTQQPCLAKKEPQHKMVWEDLSSRFFSHSEKNPEKTPG